MPGTATAASAAAATPGVRYEFDAEFQAKIAALALRDTTFAQITEGLIDPGYFENTGVAALMSVCRSYYDKYKKAPTDKSTLAQLLVDAQRGKVLPAEVVKLAVAEVPALFSADISAREFVADQCGTFARHQAVTKAILDSVSLIDLRDFDAIGALVRKALDVGTTQGSASYNYADNVELRTQNRKDRAAGLRPPTGITTGYPVLDDYLYHKGWGRREMAVLMGAAKAGKSMGLISFGVNAIGAGYKVLYVTLEVAAAIIAERMDANISDIVMHELELKPHEVEERVKKFNASAAQFEIEEAPTGTLTVSALRRIIDRYKNQGTVFDLVIVDYADLMKPERVTDNIQENSKQVYVDLRGLAMQEGFALLTATQTNREGAKKAVATMTDVAEDFNKIRIADIVISINKSEEERQASEARLYFAASRNQKSGFTLRIQQDIDRARFIAGIVGEE